MNLDERVKKLEKQMKVPSFELGTTKIAWESLTNREQKLFERLKVLHMEYGDNLEQIPEETAKEMLALSSKGTQILSLRAFDIFYTFMTNVHLKNEEFYQYIFWVRFFAFFNSTFNIIEKLRRDDEFYKKFKEEYGENWPDVLQEKHGDDWPQPDLSDIGETDFNKTLTNINKSNKLA